MERFNLNTLNGVEGKEHYWVEISGRSTTSEKCDDDVDSTTSWETVREDIRISAK
jgi:hypothetical protein